MALDGAVLELDPHLIDARRTLAQQPVLKAEAAHQIHLLLDVLAGGKAIRLLRAGEECGRLQLTPIALQTVS